MSKLEDRAKRLRMPLSITVVRCCFSQAALGFHRLNMCTYALEPFELQKRHLFGSEAFCQAIDFVHDVPRGWMKSQTTMGNLAFCGRNKGQI